MITFITNNTLGNRKLNGDGPEVNKKVARICNTAYRQSEPHLNLSYATGMTELKKLESLKCLRQIKYFFWSSTFDLIYLHCQQSTHNHQQ